MTTEMNQRIVCAANRNKFVSFDILLGVRHWNDFMRSQLDGRDSYDDYEQGFIDNRGDFLTREEAWVVAEREGQIIRRVGGDEGVLYSENLY